MKIEWGEQVSSVVDIIQNQGYIEVPRKPRKAKNRWVWKPPTFGQIKMNMDGSFLGFSSRRDIEDLFNDSKDRVLLQSSNEVQANSKMHVEVLAF